MITKKEMLLDIKKMLIVLSAVTNRNTEGAELLEEWLNKYKEKK